MHCIFSDLSLFQTPSNHGKVRSGNVDTMFQPNDIEHHPAASHERGNHNQTTHAQ